MRARAGIELGYRLYGTKKQAGGWGLEQESRLKAAVRNRKYCGLGIQDAFVCTPSVKTRFMKLNGSASVSSKCND
jgi:hypothetical protein